MTDRCRLESVAALDALEAQARQLAQLIEPLRAQDVDAVHDARVASRRLRAVLAEHKGLFGKKLLLAAGGNIRRITADLGTARELDVALADLKNVEAKLTGPGNKNARSAARHAAGFLQKLRKAESPRIMEVAALMESAEFKQALVALRPSDKKSRPCYFRVASRRTTRRFDDVVDAAKAWKADSTPQNLHAVRIAFKKLRYACEIHRGVYGPAMGDFIECLKDAQDSVGLWHDYSVLQQYIEQARAGATRAAAYARGYNALGTHVAAQVSFLLDMFRRYAEVFFFPEQLDRFRRFLSGKISGLQQCSGESKCE